MKGACGCLPHQRGKSRAVDKDVDQGSPASLPALALSSRTSINNVCSLKLRMDRSTVISHQFVSLWHKEVAEMLMNTHPSDNCGALTNNPELLERELEVVGLRLNHFDLQQRALRF